MIYFLNPNFSSDIVFVNLVNNKGYIHFKSLEKAFKNKF